MKIFVVIVSVSEKTVKHGTPITLEQLSKGEVYLTFETEDKALQAIADKPKETKSDALIEFVSSYKKDSAIGGYMNLNRTLVYLLYAIEEVKEITFVVSGWDNEFAYRKMYTVKK